MNWNFFSGVGYLSVVLWLTVPVLWTLHAVRRPRRWLCHYALAVAVAALVFAEINSETHVNRIQIDRSEEIAAAQARQAAARRAVEAARAADVAQVRFAEDDADDYLDAGGMDDADLKFMASFDEDATPEWKKARRERSEARQQDDSLEASLDTSVAEAKGVDADLVEESASEPIIMPEKQMMLANRLDGLNLKLIRWLILIGVGVIAVDYLKRANCDGEAYAPLPLPSRWVNDLTPLPPVRTWPSEPRRSIRDELEWLIKRGDTFLFLTDDRQLAASLPEQAWRIPRFRMGPVDIIHVTDANPVSSDFIAETLWYGRSSVVVHSAERAQDVMKRLVERLRERKRNRARVRQTLHVVLDLSAPIPPETVEEFERLGRATGVALVMRS